MTDFISTWNVPPGGKIVLPLAEGSRIYNGPNGDLPVTVFWGDNTSTTYVNFQVTSLNRPSHDYINGGTITLVITTGICTLWSFGFVPTSKDMLISIQSYGGVSFDPDNGRQFLNCTNLVSFPSSGNTPIIINAFEMFMGCVNLTSGLIRIVDGAMLNMSRMFYNCENFTGTFSGLPERVTTMSQMFYNCQKFNSNISGWNVSNVTTMSQMFYNCYIFNSNISGWSVAKVTTMSQMFYNCDNFRIDLSNWNLSKIENDLSAPSFTNEYITSVLPLFSTANSTAWSFAQNVTPNVINTIMPEASKTLHHMYGLRLVVNYYVCAWDVGIGRSISLPFVQDSILHCNVYWGDSTSNTYNIFVDPQNRPTHTYTVSGTIYIKIIGIFNGWSFGSVPTSRNFFLSILSYGTLDLFNGGSQFKDCINLTSITSYIGLFSLSSNSSNMLSGCVKFNGNMTTWNASNVTSMSHMFEGCTALIGTNMFTLPQGNAVNDTSYMFNGCTNFNGNLSAWDVSKVTTMSFMFNSCRGLIGTNMFNLPQGNSVNDTSYMFNDCTNFNGNLSAWDVSKVKDMSSMFNNCTNFTGGDLSAWDVSKVKDMSSMFNNCTNFNGNISEWDVLNVNNMSSMFNRCVNFNGNLSEWDVSNVTNMLEMFFNCVIFTGGDLSKWNVSKVQNMIRMFFLCLVFNGDISTWDVSNVKNMQNILFFCNLFRINISKWNVSSLTSAQNAPSLTDQYITAVKPLFSSAHPNAWRFNKALVDASVINVILPPASRSLYYIDNNQRLRSVTIADIKKKVSKFYSSAIINSYNTAIM